LRVGCALNNESILNNKLKKAYDVVTTRTKFYALIPIIAALVLSFISIQLAQAAAFIYSRPLTMPRELHTATLLQDGRVLVIGGGIIFADTAAELYDPATATWTPTSECGIRG